MAGEVLNMNILDMNKHRCKLENLYFKNRHKTIYSTLAIIKRNENKLPFFNNINSILFLQSKY